MNSPICQRDIAAVTFQRKSGVQRYLRRERPLSVSRSKLREYNSYKSGQHTDSSDCWRYGEPPWPRNIDFVDRDEELRMLWKTLQPQRGPRKLCVVAGAAGIGKTQLALEYVYRFGDKYARSLWLRCGEDPLPTQKPQDIQLVIVDLFTNSSNSSDIRSCLDKLPEENTSVLITERNPGPDADVLLEGLPDADAVKWLNDALPASWQGWFNGHLQELCQSVRSVPFPLSVLRRILRRGYRTPSEILQRIHELGARSWLSNEIERDPSLSYCPVEALPVALAVLQ